MDKENRKWIAYVMPPITLFGSSLNRPRELDPAEKWFSKCAETINFTGYSSQWMELWKVYLKPDGLIWLLVKLPLRLVRGKYLLFTSNARDPQGIVAFLFGKLLRKPVIIHDSFYYWPKRFLAKLLWPFCKFTASHASVFTVSSERVKDFWKRGGIPENKIKGGHGLVSMINVERKTILLANQIKARLGYQKVILFVGGLIERKGIEYLIRSFASVSKEVPNAGLLIVGDGPDRNRLEGLRDGLKLNNVHFAGFVSQKELAAYYVLCDIFVLPSINLKVHEEWGLVVNEAMSVGKPVIVTDSVGCAYELVKNNVNGFIVPEKDTDALSKAIIKLLFDDDARTRMGKESRKIIEEGFTYQHSINAIKDNIRSALRQGS